jgi:hypothetical protein
MCSDIRCSFSGTGPAANRRQPQQQKSLQLAESPTCSSATDAQDNNINSMLLTSLTLEQTVSSDHPGTYPSAPQESGIDLCHITTYVLTYLVCIQQVYCLQAACGAWWMFWPPPHSSSQPGAPRTRGPIPPGTLKAATAALLPLPAPPWSAVHAALQCMYIAVFLRSSQQMRSCGWRGDRLRRGAVLKRRTKNAQRHRQSLSR